MAGNKNLYCDTQARVLVASTLLNSPVPFPTLVQGETPTIDLFFLDSTGGTQAAPFTYVGLSGAAVKMAIIAGLPTGGPDTAIAFQNTWANISGGFEAGLNLNTVGISNALGNAASVACTVEVEVTPIGGTPIKYFQGPCTIKSAVIDSFSAVPTPGASYYTVTQANNTFLFKIEGPGVVWRSKSPNGLWFRDLGVNNDGSALDNTGLL